jgi:hypothetical protein
MPHLEPTYLRYIYDGLVKGSIHPENAAELPDGLIGMYEEAFDERKSVIERQKLLQLFAIWALLKKEVSAAFVAEVLGESEDDIQEFISTYSAWFNSPESGKYQLYHERLKVYLLQKLSEGEVHTLHEKLITRLERAIEEQKADEFEWYGLEFLAGHLAVAAMLNGDGKKLIELAYSKTHWQRQLKISKGYSWTNSGLKEVMTWASKYNDDEVIECGLQMVDLHHQEQNAAPQIVALVADGDFDAALKRIEQFGGSDKEGLKRKFTLYMLCLMELTLLDSKDKPHRKEGIEKLLKHLDEQLPVDHSILNWSDFFPSKLMFDILIGVLKQNISLGFIIMRSNYFDLNFVIKSEALTELEIKLIQEIFLFDAEASLRTIIMLSEISKLLYSHNYIQEATFLKLKAKDLSNSIKGYDRDLALKSIISTYHFQRNKNESINLISAIDSELLKQKVYLYLNEHEELFDDSVIKIITDFESVEEKLNLLQTGIEICLVNNKSHDRLLNIYIDNLEELDIFEQPVFQVFLVDTYCKINQIENAIEIADEIELFHEQEIAFHIIALWYFNNDNENKFKDYIEKINSAEIKARVYSNLIISIRSNNLKTSISCYLELLISEINNLDSYSTDDWGNTEYPRNELIIELGLKFQSNELIHLAIELESLIIDEWDAKKLYCLKIFSDFDFLKDGILSPYFHSYILINKKEIELSSRDEYLIQIIMETWDSNYFKKALCILPFITNNQKLEKIISDLVFLSLESLNFSFLPDLLNFMDSDFSKDVCLSQALSKSEIKFELNQLKQIFSNFHEADERDQNIASFVKREFDQCRPITANQLIDLIINPFWKCIGLECSVYYFGKVMNLEKGKKQIEEIKDIKRRFKANIDVYEIEMNFFDIISSEMYLNNDESWIDYNIRSISISKKIINQNVKKYNEFFFLLRTKQYSDLLNQIELITDDWDRSLFISGIGIELFCVEHIEIIERIISLYPENQKEGSPEYRNFISKYILLCERNNQNQYLVKYYKYFESSWLDSLELAKQLLQINRLIKADQILNSIADWRKAWAYIRFSKFLRIHNYNKKSKHYLEKGLSISMKKNESTGIKRATIELINSGNFLHAEKISLEIKKIKDKQDCWSDIGRALYANKSKVIINSQFKEIEFKKFVNRSWLEEHTIIDSNKQFIINSLPHSIEDLSIIETILQKYFLNKIFLDLNFEEPKSQFDNILKLHWAIEIKNQINYLS